MLRLSLVVVALVGCDMGPIKEHRIRYEHAGFGGVDAHVEVDLDKRTAVRLHLKDVTQQTLSEADVKQLGDLASCARDEKVDPTPMFDDHTSLVLDGDKRREITHGGRTTSPCTARLEDRLAAFVR